MQRAAEALVAHGRRDEAAEAVGICLRTMDAWMRDARFMAYYTAAREQNRLSLTALQTVAIERAYAKLMIRLDLGDEVVHVVDGVPTITRRAVSAKDCALIAAITIDKRAMMDGKGGPADTQDDRLAALMVKLEGIAQTAGSSDVSIGMAKDITPPDER
jgi:hypothetical protein